MDFRIADTFTSSIVKLTGDEQKAVKQTAFDLQMNLANPGLSFHKLDKARDRNFWSVRVNRDVRLIVHRSESSLLLCYVDHHDKAYEWAERRKLETHPTTGAAQLVEVRERVEEITVPKYIDVEVPSPRKPRLFDGISDDQLLGYGVPPEWLADVRAANEDSLLELADHLPVEAAEALLELATGGAPAAAPVIAQGANEFEHPDAQRRFRVMADIEELERALEFPWDKWTIFLHPAQRQWVERDYSGPARVSGSAGTGKTIVALHRAVYLAKRHPDARILLTTFSDALAYSLEAKLFRLVSNQPRLAERIEVSALDTIGERLYDRQFGKVSHPTVAELRDWLTQAAAAVPDMKFGTPFLLAEWKDVVDAWQIDSWEAYRDVRRLGRKTRLSELLRADLWKVFAAVLERLQGSGKMTKAQMFARLAESMAQRKHPLFDHVVVDESQDISVAQLRFLAAVGKARGDALFFAGDLGQRIFQQPFSWTAVGVDVRGRARTLKINYRTSHQIRSQADRLLSGEVADVDGNVEVRAGTVSIFNGPPPLLQSFDTAAEESVTVGKWIAQLRTDGVRAEEIGVFVRSGNELQRAVEAVTSAGLDHYLLDSDRNSAEGKVSISTMHLAKGMEFKAVAVMACDDEIIPLQERIESVSDPSDLEEVFNTERHLLYVACTRARDYLSVSAVRPVSEFLEDLLS
jgi:superfamily I DNA/RNA helicase/mRNA-degrading endonuclease RelE of RelBE toxin-antitoxin system